jgi:hypothetical protein
MAEKMVRSKRRIIESAEELLRSARRHAADYDTQGDRKITGLYASISSGRSVTWALQNLRSVVDDFDEWYVPLQEEMRADPLARWFVELRNQIEKRGELQIEAIEGGFQGVSTGTIHAHHTPPEGATASVVDRYGRFYWIVERPSGIEEHVYLDNVVGLRSTMPRIIIKDSPEREDVGVLLRRWLDSLETLVAKARKRFLSE